MTNKDPVEYFAKESFNLTPGLISKGFLGREVPYSDPKEIDK